MEHIGEIEKRLWSSADNLRANSNFASNEYFLPVMGLIFLRHAYSRFLKVKAEIEPSLPRRGGRPRALTKEDFSRKGAIFLHPEAQFDHLVSLPDGVDRAQVIIDAMEQIERDYRTLRGALPKAEYQELDNDVLGQLLRTFNDPALRRAHGDVFGRTTSTSSPSSPTRRRMTAASSSRRWRWCRPSSTSSNRTMAACSTRPAARAACSCRAILRR